MPMTRPYAGVASRVSRLTSRVVASRRRRRTVALYLFSEVIFFAKVSKDGVFIN